ncbi:MAG: cupin domain-containing protein [Burkholderiaceae bacterium]|nr:cupin domain-containing protein [Burkholderiaceae bacterium]
MSVHRPKTRRGQVPLGKTSLEQFMRRHWQRAPLVVRNAVPEASGLFDIDAVLEMSTRDEVESRLVQLRGSRRWLADGPFDASEIPSLATPRWTALVQGVDLHLPAGRALLDRFRFVPDVRLDDLMISVAGDGGGVGPHADQYDVFLLQLEGIREWRIAPPGDWPLRAGEPLRIIDGFCPAESHHLEAGDMLYLPPGWAHDGIARGPCMTASIGFRSPARTELLDAFFEWLAEGNGRAEQPGQHPGERYTDVGSRPTSNPGRIPPGMMTALRQWIDGWRPERTATEQFIGSFLTEPKADVWFEPPRRPLTRARFIERARHNGLILDRRTRAAYTGERFFINGEAYRANHPGFVTWLRALVDRRHLPPEVVGRFIDSISDAGTEFDTIVYAAYRFGWIHPVPGGARRKTDPV